MADIEQKLRSAMHDATDGEVAATEELIVAVKRRHRRHRATVAAATFVAAVAIVVPTVVAVHRGITGSGARSLTNAAAAGTKRSSTLSGLPMPPGKNFEVLVTTTYGAGWYSTATHKTTPIKGLPATFSGYQFSRLNAGWAASPVSYNSPCSINVCAGPPTTYYFIADGSATATRIGAGYAQAGIAAGTRAGTVWLDTYPKVTTTFATSSFARLVSTAGRPLGPRYQLLANYFLQGAVGRYLLLNSNDNNNAFVLWDPRRRSVVGHFENVVASSPHLIIWSHGCQRCQLLITNASTGKTLTATIPGLEPANCNATLSDDGRLLAVQLTNGEIAVYNTVTGSLTHIPGTALSTAEFEYFDWQNGGHRLVIRAGPNIGPGADQLAYWQPGDRHLYVATIRNPNDMEQLQTGSE